MCGVEGEGERGRGGEGQRYLNFIANDLDDSACNEGNTRLVSA